MTENPRIERPAHTTGSTHFTLFTPFPVNTHPEAELLDSRTSSWIERHNLGINDTDREILKRTRSGHMAAKLFPDAETSRVQVASDFIGFEFTLDDIVDVLAVQEFKQYVQRAGKLQRLMDAPNSSPIDDDPYGVALIDLVARFSEFGTSVQLHRLAAGFKSFLFAAAWPASCQSSRTSLSINEYWALRISSFGLSSLLPVFEMVNGYQVDDEDLANPDVRALIEMVSFIGGCDNDLFSWSKELSAGAGELNAIDILAARHGGGIRRATEQVVGMRNCAMALFIKLRESVCKNASCVLRMYLRDLEIFISAWLDVQQSSARYSVAESLEISPAKLLSLMSGVPEGSTSLSPIPTVAWWFDRISRRGS